MISSNQKADRNMKRILVLCRTNSALSIMIAALFNARSDGQWQAFSAGPQPGPAINPHAVSALRNGGILIETGARPQSWLAFEGPDAPRFDVVLTVAEDVDWHDMPAWNGVPRLMHWPMPDPLGFACAPHERTAMFAALLDLARTRVEAFLAEDATRARGEGDNDNRRLALRRVGT